MERKEIVWEKSCRRCHKKLPLSQFPTRKHKKDGHSSVCKGCSHSRKKEQYKVNSELKKKYNHTYREHNKEKCKFLTREYMHKTRWMALTKIAEVHHIGSPSCMVCGFTDARSLQIDHVNGGGTSQLRKMGSYKFYRYILDSSPKLIRDNYQILCANCNMIKKEEERENYIWRERN